ncbi:unnamed protein product [Owenia fusiformis]|uniref:Uncharacterized protein n=1 Tax=Owenia fusiformis TaxID=6347 RepID=A0A8J1UAE7_OWEFU|nr:unnamed protein product [Owenia fusiformis]
MIMISVLLCATILATSFAIPFKDGSFVHPKDIQKVPIGPTSDEYVRDLMVNIGKNAEVFADVAHHATSQETIDSLFDATETIKGGMIDEPPALQIQCLVCEQLIEILQRGLTEAGNDPDIAWEALRPIAEELCNNVLGVAGLNAEAMCPGIMGHYVPHLLYILHNKTMSPSYACTELNFCDVEDISADGQALPIYIKDNETPMERFDDRKKRQAPGSTFRIAFLTDVHVDSRYTVGAPTDCGMIICCRVGADYTGEGSAGRFGSYSCNTPIRTMDLFMQGIANLAEKPDIVLYGGDAPPHALWEETFDGQMQASQATVEAFSRNMPGMRVFPTIGNHETYPGNLYYLPRQEIQDMNRMFTEWWRPLANFSDENVRTWQANGYYTTLIRPGLRILTFNSNYGYTMNFYNLLNVDTLELVQLKTFMNDTLQTARNNNEKVIMLGHHPTGSAQNHWGRFYTELVLQFGDVIALQQCGHTHRDHFTMLQTSNQTFS